MQSSLKFLSQINRGGTSDYPIEAIERALTAQGVPSLVNDGPLFRTAGKIAARVGFARNIYPVTRTCYLVPIMGPCFYRFFPVVYGARTIPLAHDCWEPQYERWVGFLKNAGIQRAFFTARQAAEAMVERVPGLQAEWLPEGIELGLFNPDRPLADRDIDILEMGRRSERFHVAIRSHSERQGYRHLYQRSSSTLVFATREAFRNGMPNSKLLVCFPSSMTNPERSGTVETMTLRYLEGMACKSVILGHAPQELIDLFGYNPVVEADFSDPAGQIDRLIVNIGDHTALVERNFSRLLEVGTWDVRIRDLLSRLADAGIAPRAHF